MPRIRKKTSKRTTTHQRAKIKHKIAEGRRKKKKEAKKNPQWKSKKKKDPGIPNEFPYKDQILAEVAQSRRQAEEAKRARKEEKKAAREGIPAKDVPEDSPSPAQEGSSSKMQPQEEAPPLLSPDLPNLQTVLDKADVVLHVLDARDPASYRLTHIEETVSSKLVFVLNKIDLVPRETIAAWTAHMRTQRTTFVFRAASAFLPKPAVVYSNAKGKAKHSESTVDAIGANPILAYLAKQANENQRQPLHVAVVGVTNTGKSAIINSLARTAAVPVYTPTPSAEASSTTTTAAYEVAVSTSPAHHTLTLIDTPGVSLRTGDHGDHKIRDLLMRSRGRLDRLKDPVPAVAHIVARATATDLMVQYALPAFAPGDTPAFLTSLARVQALLRRGGAPDTLAAARRVLRDWAGGRLLFCADAPTAAGAAEDVAGLEGLRTRSEMQRGAGLVRIRPGEAEARRVDLGGVFVGHRDAPEVEVNGPGGADEISEDGSEEDENSGDEVSLNGNDDDEDEEDEDAGAEEEENASASAEDVPPRGKRKRTAATKTAPPAKKVAFAVETRDRREARQSKPAPKLVSKAVLKSTSKTAPKSVLKPTPKSALKPAPKSVLKPAPKSALKPAPAKSSKGSLAIKALDSTAETASDAYDFGQFFK